MADKQIGELTAATAVTAGDLFVLQQNDTAKKLTAQILENWLVALADGHGGIQSIVKTSSSGLVDTYTITLADLTTTTFTVTNGKAISSVTTYYAVSYDGSTAPSSWSTTRQSMTATDRYLWSYQTIAFNDSSTIDTVKTVIGVWGDKGDTGAAGRGIEDLEQTSRVPGSYTLYTFTMSDGTTETFYSYDGVGISGIEKTSTVGLVDTYTISYTNNTTSSFTVTNARSISSVTKTSSNGLVDTYTVSFNDGTTTTFTVTNGSSISTIAKTSTVGLVDTYTVTLTNGATSTFTVKNAKSIVSVTMVSGTHAAGTTDTYRITFNDGDTTNFTVYNGTNGTGSVSTVDGIPSSNQNVTLLLTGNGPPTESTVGQLKQRYFDLSNQILYICVGIDTSSNPVTYSWAGTGVPVDSALSSSSENPVQNKVITAKVGTEALTTTATDLSGAVNELNVGKADKVQGATNGNFAALDANGNLTDSGHKNSDYAVSSAGVPAGGSTGQVLKKQSATDYDTAWQPDDLGITGASVGDLVRISAVSSGKPTAFTKVPVNAIKYNPNLLDNWYFVGGGSQLGYGVFPINQRGQAPSYSVTYAKTIDRWGPFNSVVNTITLLPDGVQISRPANANGNWTFTQDVESQAALSGKTVTFSILFKNSTAQFFNLILRQEGTVAKSSYSPNFYGNNGLASFTVTLDDSLSLLKVIVGLEPAASSMTLIAAKLELGSAQTLAHQENGEWVLNELPDYETELLRCKTSTADPSDTYANGSVEFGNNIGIVQNTNTATQNITAGQYVIWKGALYTASAAIASGATLSGSNLTAVTGGGLNAIRSSLESYTLPSKFITLDSNTSSIHLPNGCRAFGVLLDSNPSNNAIYYLNTNSSGSPVAGLLSVSGPTFTTSNNTVTFNIASGVLYRVMIFALNASNINDIYSI